MKSRTFIAQLGKLIATDMANGEISDRLRLVGDSLASLPGSTGEVVALIAAESGKKRPNARLIEAFAVMLGEGLVVLRYGIERGHRQAIDQVAAIRSQVAGLANRGELDTEMLMMVMRTFTDAKLEPGDELQAVMMSAVDRETGTGEVNPADFVRMLEDMIRGCGGDVFEFQAYVLERAAMIPDDVRTMMAVAMLTASDPGVREAAVAWVLDPGLATRRQAAASLLAAAEVGQVSGIMLRRLITIRNWLPDGERPAIDSVIKACRLKGVEIAPLPPVEVSRIAATAVDGSRAQSFFAIIKHGRKRAIVAVLLKPAGIGDTWINAGLSHAQAKDFMEDIGTRIEGFESGIAHLRLALGHGLAASRESGALPPFGLVDVVERMGLGMLQPEAVPVETLMAMLLDEVGAAEKAAPMVEKALKASARWGSSYRFFESWFDDNAALDALLAGKKLSGDQRAVLLMQDYFPGRRRHWAELMAWTALTLRQDETVAADWLSFALVARELLGARKLAEIPAMVAIVSKTLAARQGRLFG